MPLKVASWNVNSLRARHAHLLEWLREASPDIVCLQETKITDDEFPVWEITVAGYDAAFTGERSYNGVAILSKTPLEDVSIGLPGDDTDAQTRLISARAGGIRVVDVYVPNGQHVGSDKYLYKLSWLDRFSRHLSNRFDPKEPLVVCGDFNIAPEDRDVFDPDAVRGSVMFSDPEHAALSRLTSWGLADALRLHHPEGGLYSYFDYRTGAFARNLGWRIDLILASAPLAAACRAAWIDLSPRGKEKPSDHAPVLAEFDLPA
jgi:exodeoxyribonuclease III